MAAICHFHDFKDICILFTAQCYASMVYAMSSCVCVCVCVTLRYCITSVSANADEPLDAASRTVDHIVLHAN